MTSPVLLLLATGNEGKARELSRLLPPGFEVLTASSLGLEIPEETGSTFEENARIKAVGLSLAVPHLTLADDSGLEVDALDGRPGVNSARYAGVHGDDAANCRRLLDELAAIPTADRAARFVCRLCLAQSGSVLAKTAGTVEGLIAFDAKGQGGFGYDPLFLFLDGRTMAELAADEKNRISHRGAALRLMIPQLIAQRDNDVEHGDRR